MVNTTPAGITPGSANRGSVVHASDASLSNLSRSHTEEGISRLQSAINTYSASLTYDVGDLSLESGIDYRCNTQITVPEAFDVSKWDEIGIDESALDQKRFMYREKRQISVINESGNIFNLIGLSASTIVEEGTGTAILDVNGLYNRFIATVGMMASPGGLFAPDCVRRDLNFDIEFKFRLNDLTDVQFVVGFLELDPFVNNPEDNEHIALVRDSTAGNTNFLISHSNGGGTVTETQVQVADTNIHTLRLVSDEANSKFQYSWDGGALVDVTTNIPAATTNLIIYLETVNLGIGTKTVDFWYVDGLADA